MFSPGTVRSVIEYGQPLSFFTTCTRIFHANSERDSTEGERRWRGLCEYLLRLMPEECRCIGEGVGNGWAGPVGRVWARFSGVNHAGIHQGSLPTGSVRS